MRTSTGNLSKGIVCCDKASSCLSHACAAANKMSRQPTLVKISKINTFLTSLNSLSAWVCSLHALKILANFKLSHPQRCYQKRLKKVLIKKSTFSLAFHHLVASPGFVHYRVCFFLKRCPGKSKSKLLHFYGFLCQLV